MSPRVRDEVTNSARWAITAVSAARIGTCLRGAKWWRAPDKIRSFALHSHPWTHVHGSTFQYEVSLCIRTRGLTSTARLSNTKFRSAFAPVDSRPRPDFPERRFAQESHPWTHVHGSTFRSGVSLMNRTRGLTSTARLSGAAFRSRIAPVDSRPRLDLRDQYPPSSVARATRSMATRKAAKRIETFVDFATLCTCSKACDILASCSRTTCSNVQRKFWRFWTHSK